MRARTHSNRLTNSIIHSGSPWHRPRFAAMLPAERWTHTEVNAPMELILILRVLLRRWWLLVIPVAVVLPFALPALIAPPTDSANPGYTVGVRYSAAQVLDAIPDREGDFQDVWRASELTVNALTDWIQSTRFSAEVRDLLVERGTPIDAAPAFRADNDNNVGILYADWHDSDELAALMDAALIVLQTRSADYFPALGGIPADVDVLDEIVVVPRPTPITNRLGPLLQVMVALLGGVGLAFLADYLDPYLRRHEQLSALGVTVLASVPRE